MKKLKYLWLVPLVAGLTACDVNNTLDEIPAETVVEIPLSGGSADFSKYVAIGNSLTAGFTDGALFQIGQVNSFPNIMSQQFANAGGGAFTQPMMNDNKGGLLLGGAPILHPVTGENRFPPRLFFDGAGPTVVPGASTTEVTSILSGGFNNVGVPGAKSFHLLAPGYGNIANLAAGLANPYFIRFASTPNATVLGDAMAQSPTFFSLWIGNNDVLSYATSGGSGVDQTGNANPATYGSNDITDPTAFAGIYSQLVTALTANGAKGAVANIPDITSIPFFTTVKWNALELTQSLADQLNAGFAAYNAGVDANRAGGAFSQHEADKRKISFSAGANPFVIFDASLTPLRDAMGMVQPGSQLRQLKKGELLTLTTPSDSIRCSGMGSVNPRTRMPNPILPQFVLDSSELASLSTAIAAYNNTIKSIADMNGLAFVDANARLRELATTGITQNGIAFTSSFITGGAFSLDGVHPATRGYAIIANDFIDAINSKYGAKVPKVDVGSFDTYEIVQ